jgi:hypothetical protein
MSGEVFNGFDKPPEPPKKAFSREKKSTEEIMKEMNEAAVLAGAEFTKEYANWTARDVVVWWAKWYLKAGHKRLGRILVAKAKGK